MHYVTTKSNPADYGTRGLNETYLAKVKMWYETKLSLGARVNMEERSKRRLNKMKRVFAFDLSFKKIR